MRPLQAAVIGHPIGHTMSPFLQRRLFELSSLPMEYHVLDVPQLSAALPQLRALDCFNVTIPHKTALIPFLDDITRQARLCGSVNTVKVENGKLYGTTTDGEGFSRALAANGLAVGESVLLLGNGGAARAILFELLSRHPGISVTVVCRDVSLEKAGALCREAQTFAVSEGGSVDQVELMTYTQLEAGSDRYSLAVNTTSLGMYPHVDGCPLSRKTLARCGGAFDAVFNPRRTRFLCLAADLGLPYGEGFDMLVYQAAASHRFWFGSQFDEEALRDLCREGKAQMDLLFEEERHR